MEGIDRLGRGALGGDVDKTVAQPRAGIGIAGDARAQHDAERVECFRQPLVRKIGRQIPDKDIALAIPYTHQLASYGNPCRLIRPNGGARCDAGPAPVNRGCSRQTAILPCN